MQLLNGIPLAQLVRVTEISEVYVKTSEDV